jgi:hypothetical protein
MTIDWIIAKLNGKHYNCFNCQKYISNSCLNMLNPYMNNYSEGGGWCVPLKNKHYYFAINPNNKFCKKFKLKKEE